MLLKLCVKIDVVIPERLLDHKQVELIKLSQMLNLIDEALVRMDDSGYGKCIRCGQAVPEKRLEAVPWARHCVPCQELHERGVLVEDDE